MGRNLLKKTRYSTFAERGVFMKRINPVVVLLVITGLASGFLLLQDSMLPQPAASRKVQHEQLTTAAEVAGDPSPPATLLQKDSASVASADSKTTLMNANSSATRDSTETTPATGQEMTFCVMGLTAKTSSVYVAVFESEAGFPKSELSSKTTVVSATEGQVRFSLELPRNQPVAIAVFQDLDGNGTLSKNQIGIPTEPYGFSNNARAILGPPSFGQAVFTVSDDRDRDELIEIKVR